MGEDEKMNLILMKIELLTKSARSNYEHGRSYIGQKKLIEAHELLTEFLGDNRPLGRAEIFVNHVKAHLEPDQFVICKICGKSVDEIFIEEVLG